MVEGVKRQKTDAGQARDDKGLSWESRWRANIRDLGVLGMEAPVSRRSCLCTGRVHWDQHC